MDIDETPESDEATQADDQIDAGLSSPTEVNPSVSNDTDGARSDPIAQDAQSDPGSRSWMRPTLFVIGSLLILALVASQTYLITTLGQTRSDLSSLKADVSTLEAEIANVETAVGDVSDDVTGLTEEIDTVKDARQRLDETSPAPTAVAGFLPRFAPGAQDTALGLVLPEITAIEAYSQETLTIDPGDGTKRIWLIWAHWCPYCQEELPMMSNWYPPNAEQFPNSELVTVTTAMDPSRGNPLDEYLASEQFPFPVLRDDDGKLSARFGVSAFPFWVVTNGDGTVLFRTAGLLGEDQVEQMFSQLETFDM